eukprot:scaffold663_cov169-Ochromonas_danica.AAC.4
MSEEVLIDMMKELPRLEILTVQPGVHRFSDDSLFAIKEYGYGRESMLAVTNHPELEEVYLYNAVIEKAAAKALLLEEEIKMKERSSKLRICKIKGDNYTLEITNEILLLTINTRIRD